MPTVAKDQTRTVRLTLLAWGFLLTSGCSSSSPPFIGAAVLAFLPGQAPAGFQNTSVIVADASSGHAITGAAVTLNGVSLAFSSADQAYEGNAPVAPGGPVKLTVAVGGSTYTATATEFTTYPVITNPGDGSTLGAPCLNSPSWTPGAPTAGATQALGMLNAADPNGQLLWPQSGLMQLSIDLNSYSIPGGQLPPGKGFLTVGIVGQFGVPGADSQSALLVGGFSYVPVTVASTPVPTSLEIGQPPLPILRGTTEVFPATEHLCNGYTQEGLGAVWTSSDTSVATIADYTASSVLAIGLDAGTTTISASLDGFVASSSLTVHGTPRISGTPNSLAAVVWSGTQFVAVGAQGTILTSPDAVSWTPRVSGTTNDLLGLVWSGSQFVAVGWGWTILTSPDAVAWTDRSLDGGNTSPFLSAVTWSGNRFVAVGNSPSGGAVFTSPDAITWTRQSVDAGLGNELNGVAWSGAAYVAVGQPGIDDARAQNVFTSTTGVTWMGESATNGSFETLQSVVWSGTQFLVGGNSLLTSPDGISWSGGSLPPTSYAGVRWHGVTWTGTEFVAVGDLGFVLTSTDGVDWAQWVTAPVCLGPDPATCQRIGLGGVTAAGANFVTVGTAGTILTSF